MLKTLVIKGFADGTDAAVHHVARADEIRTGAGLHHRLLAELINGLVVQHDTLFTDDAVMAIAGIRIERDIRHDRHLRDLLLQLSDRTGNQSVLVEALSTVFGLEPFSHLGEQHHTTNAEIPGTPHLTSELIQAPATGAWHGTDWFNPGTLMDEQGVNEVCRRQACFTNHGAQCRRSTQAARAVGEIHQQALI